MTYVRHGICDSDCSDKFAASVNHDNGVIIGVAAFGAVLNEPARNGIVWEFSRPLNLEEDQGVTLTGPGFRPVPELAPVEGVPTVTDIDGVSGDVEVSCVVVSESNNIRISTVSFICVRSGAVIVIDLNRIPLYSDMFICEGLQRGPELWAHPGAAAQPRPVRPATDDAEGLALPWAGLETVIVGGQGLPEEFRVYLGKVFGRVLFHKCGHPDMCIESR